MVSKQNPQIGIVVVAAGSGTRYGDTLPKQFVSLCGQPVLSHCIEAFRAALPEAHIVLVLSEDGRRLWTDLCKASGFESPELAIGGASRGESVKAGLDALTCSGLSGEAPVLIHDGARPLLSQELILRIVEAMTQGADGAVPSLDMSDSMVELDDKGGFTPVSRTRFRTVQTPQAFRLGAILDAYSGDSSFGFTDDLSLMRAAGFDNLVLVEGQRDNIKITHPSDLATATALLAQRKAKQ